MENISEDYKLTIMKELSIEEKAKAYDKAIEKLRDFYRNYDTVSCLIDVKEELANLLPELKESDDEQIREAMIKGLSSCGTKYWGGFEVKAAIDWLEKQEPIDKEKVLIGARKDVALSIINYLDNNSVGMCLSNMECEDIKDACVNSKWTKLYNYMKKKLEKQGEQQDVNIQINPSEYINDIGGNGCYLKNTTQASAWSEEDEHRLSDTIYFLDTAKKHYASTIELDACIDWIKSLKERYTWKPSDEQIKDCKKVYADILSAKGFDLGTVNSELNRLEEELKELKE